VCDKKQNDGQLQKAERAKPAECVWWFRQVIQVGFVAFSILLGLQFHSFVLSLAGRADGPIKQRPSAVEAYLPISSLMSLVYLIRTSVANRVHPAGLIIFTVTVVLTVLIRRGFCSWVCPIGTAEEWAYKIGRRLLGRNLKMPKWLDFALRSLKYGLLGFFLYHILLMPIVALREFIYSPYNRIADVKMYMFFRYISVTALTVIIVLAFLSLLFKNFLCRYLCPYGALLGLLSALSPVAIRRNVDKCTDCGMCGRACPNQIPVDKKKTVHSVECTACFDCIEACRVHGAISMCLPKETIRISAFAYGIITVAMFFFSAQVGQTLNYWQSDTSDWMYKSLYSRITEVRHP